MLIKSSLCSYSQRAHFYRTQFQFCRPAGGALFNLDLAERSRSAGLKSDLRRLDMYYVR